MEKGQIISQHDGRVKGGLVESVFAVRARLAKNAKNRGERPSAAERGALGTGTNEGTAGQGS